MEKPIKTPPLPKAKFVKKSNQRKVFLINPPFQIRIIGYMLAIASTVTVIYYGAHSYFFWKLHQLGLDSKLPVNHIYFRFLENQNSKMNSIFMYSTILVVLAICSWGLFLSHRIAGPIHHLKEHFKKIVSGQKLPPLKFRKNDFFMEVPDILNQYIGQQDKNKEKDKVA